MSEHPITPPPELVQQWLQEHYSALPVSGVTPSESALYITTQAANWGADKELKACAEWMKLHLHSGSRLSRQLRTARRPKLPSLAEEGQRILVENGSTLDGRVELDPEDVATIRAALERLKQYEQENNDN